MRSAFRWLYANYEMAAYAFAAMMACALAAAVALTSGR